MARKTSMFTVSNEGRDKGKMFLLTEMPASKAESWAMRVLLALMASNVNLPENFENLGMAALAELGLKSISGLKWDVAEPLLNEMLGCVEIIPDSKKTNVRRELIEQDVEEIMTRLQLRMEVWNLHMGFLAAVLPSLKGKEKAAEKSSIGITASRK